MRLMDFCRAAVLSCLSLFALAAHAGVNIEKPLAEDEGWLAVIIDNEAGMSSILLDGPGLLGDDVVRKLANGRNVRVVRAKPGKYRWSRLSRVDGYVSIERDAQFEFVVEAGKLNYPGNFTIEATGFRSVRYYRSNAAVQAMMELDQAFKGLRGKYPWHSDLPSPDPFAAFAIGKLDPEKSDTLMASAEADAKRWRERPVDETFTAIFNDLYMPARAMWPAISPDGKLLAFKQRRGDLEVAVVVDLADGEVYDLAAVPGRVDQLLWASDRALYVGVYADTFKVLARAKGKRETIPLDLASGVHLFRFGEGKPDESGRTRLWLPGAIWVGDPLVDDPRRGLIVRADSSGELHVYAFDETAKRFDISDFRNEHRLDKGIEHAIGFYPDAAGELRVALVLNEDGSRAIGVRGEDGKWRIHPKLPDNIQLTPVQLTAAGDALVVLTDHAREQVELATVNLADGTIGPTLLAEPGADLVDAVVRRRDRQVIGAQFYRNGSLQTRFLDGVDTAQLKVFAKTFPDADLHLFDASRDGNRLVVLVKSESERGTFYLYDRAARRIEKLVDAFDALKVAKPFASTAFTVTAAGGLPIDGFLTLPGGAEKAPLVVMPHGGPIDVSDRRAFDPLVQMLANRGFAVLRVNYRGSGGAGRAFRSAGEGQWGREIESDIDAALAHALDHFPLDRTRVALLGASYGGYSTLMGIIRNPERYRCGVAVAPVTDLPLKFSSSDWNRIPEAVARMKKIVGDPASELAQLQEFSPDYQYERLTRPILLIHGTKDMRVAFEHSWRLRMLLASAGKPPAWLPLPGADHSVSRLEDRLAMHAASDAFLRECLAPEATK
jgi:dipeptidyl aminopeptidase/acylaminoacyl peptidase